MLLKLLSISAEQIKQQLTSWQSPLISYLDLHQSQARIYIYIYIYFRIWTIPYGNLEMRILFQIFRSIFFFIIFCYKSTLHIDYIYVCYIQLVSFQTLQTKMIWENEIYFHYWSGGLQLLHSCGYPCSQWIEKFYLCAALNFQTFPKNLQSIQTIPFLIFPE